MQLNQIHYLVAVADAGSLREAARRLGVSQPAMTKSLRLLERDCEAQLLIRTSRGVALTAAGRSLVARARLIQTELRRAKEELARHHGSAGTVAVGVAGVSTIAVIPEAVRDFQSRHPKARIRILEASRDALVPLVRDGTLDFGIAQAPTGSIGAGMEFRPLFRPRLVVACRRGSSFANARSLRQLADATWILFNPPGGGGMLERAYRAAGIPPPETIIYCESYAAALMLVARSNILALLLAQILDDPIATRFLQRVNVKEEIQSPNLGMFTRADTQLAPAATALVQSVTAVARALARQR